MGQRRMNGTDLKKWRDKHGFTQADLMRELEVKSRQTISNWENSSNEIPRMLVLSLTALADIPECRNFYGKSATAKEKRRSKKL
jgi:transcriptional regulator with XRE-family HTH domain